ncbi:MAG: DUF3971 domain-containing protein [Immundisolibacterales bacterium]|nr:DUF3971 domain-containing protein [Immundisolibacterales bacterium]
MSDPDQANASDAPAREPVPPAPAPSPPRRRQWLRALVLALALLVVLVAGAAGWLVLDPGLVRPIAERLATTATGRPVTIGTLDFRLLEGRVLIDATQVRVGQTTTERVSMSLSGMRSHARGEGVRFPNGSSLEQFRATLDFSVAGVPRISTVDATGAVLVAARRAQSDPSGPPPLARLLIVPRILLGLGLERLVIHSGAIEYRGRKSVHNAGVSVVLAAAQDDLSVRGELLVAENSPPVPFDGTVRNPMDEDWEIDLRLTGDRVPMEGVRFMTGVLEPGPTVGRTLERISNESRFLLSVRIARARIETVSLDFAFEAPQSSGTDPISLEGVRFLAHAVPDPAGWTVTGEVDWSGLPEGEGAEQTPFVVRWSNGVPGSLRWSARRVAVPILARLAGRTFGSGSAFGDALDRLRPAGMIDEIAGFGDPAAGGESAPFWLSALVSGLGASAGELRISDGRARVELAEGEWRVRFVDDRLDVSLPSFRSSPYEMTLRGELRVAIAEEGWTMRTAGLELGAAGLEARLEGSLAAPLSGRPGTPRLDLEARLDDVPLADLAAVLPDLRGGGFSRWYRRAVRSGRLTGAALTVRGDPREIPYADGDGTFEVRGTVRDVDFAYAERWPAARVEEAGFRMRGTALEFTEIRGSIFDSVFDNGSALVGDATDPAGRVQVSLSGSGPAADLLEFLRTSPLGTGDEGAARDVRADGPAATAFSLDVPYGRDARERPLDARGTIELDGVALRLAGRAAVLEDVRGELRFDSASLAGGPLHGRFRDEPIEAHVKFERGAGLQLRFSGQADGDWFSVALLDLANLGEEETAPWLEHLHGRTAWEAEYRGRDGIVFRSDLRAASVDYPPPFEKPAGTTRSLEALITPGESEWLIEAGYGPDTSGVFEVVETLGEWKLARGAVVIGGDPPELPAADHIEVSGELTELDIDRWFALGAPGTTGAAGWVSRIGKLEIATGAARAFGRPIELDRIELEPASDGSGFEIRLTGGGVAGIVLYPSDPGSGRARAHFERLHLGAGLDDEESRRDEETPDEPSATERVAGRWPAFDVRIDSLRFEGIDFGAAQATGNRTGNGLELAELIADAPDFTVRGSGIWSTGEDGAPASRLDIRLNTADVSRVLIAAGAEKDAAAAGAVDLHLDLAWPGSPFAPSLAGIEGEIGLSAREGHIPRVRVGPFARLLSLMSLNALPRVLALDLSHVVGKGFAYDSLVARTEVEEGTARIREFTISGPSARIEVSGNVDLVAREYDQEIAVIPRVTRSGALLPIWATVWPVLVGNFVLEKVAGKDVFLDRLFRLKYRVEGSWDDPQIERVKVPQPGEETQ